MAAGGRVRAVSPHDGTRGAHTNLNMADMPAATIGIKRPASVALPQPTTTTKKREKDPFDAAFENGNLPSPCARIALCPPGTHLVPASCTFCFCAADGASVCFALLDPRLFRHWEWCRSIKASPIKQLKVGTVVDGLLAELSEEQKSNKPGRRRRLKELQLQWEGLHNSTPAKKPGNYEKVAAWLYCLARNRPRATAPLNLDTAILNAQLGMDIEGATQPLVDSTQQLAHESAWELCGIPTPSPPASPLQSPNHREAHDDLGFTTWLCGPASNRPRAAAPLNNLDTATCNAWLELCATGPSVDSMQVANDSMQGLGDDCFPPPSPTASPRSLEDGPGSTLMFELPGLRDTPLDPCSPLAADKQRSTLPAQSNDCGDTMPVDSISLAYGHKGDDLQHAAPIGSIWQGVCIAQTYSAQLQDDMFSCGASDSFAQDIGSSEALLFIGEDNDGSAPRINGQQWTDYWAPAVEDEPSTEVRGDSTQAADWNLSKEMQSDTFGTYHPPGL